MSNNILELKNITKEFDSIMVLKNISFDLQPSEIHAIVGENGAGKTTVMNILSGIYQQSSGSIFLNGEEVKIENAKQAMNLSIATVFQNDSLFENLNIAQNIFANREPRLKNSFTRMIDWDTINKQTKQILDFLHLKVTPDTYVRFLTLAERKFVEIARAIVSNAKIIIMDEPTSSLSEKEVDFLFSIIRHLKKTGASVIYISHRYEELWKIADRITIFRDGQTIATLERNEINASTLFRMIIGDEIKSRYPKLTVKKLEEILIVKNLYTQYISDVSFSLRKGEILGIAGLKGSGKTSLARALFGLDKIISGSVYLKGDKIKLSDTEKASQYGISFVPSNRFNRGLIMKTDIASNTVITSLDKIKEFHLLSKKKMRSVTQNYKKMLNIKYNDPMEKITNLSGGNQKKVMLSKWLFKNSQVIILNEPTSSIDINSKVEIYNIINELVMSGVGIIFISSEIPELLGMCDRIIVMSKGHISKVLQSDKTNQEEILRFASE